MSSPAGFRPKQLESFRRPRRGILLHLLRAALFVGVIVLIHQQHDLYQARQAGIDARAVEPQQLRKFYPQAAALSAWDAEHEGRSVVNGDGKILGFVVQTSPTSDPIVGYSGPTNTLIAFDADGNILGIELLSSGDTEEHVRDVASDESFMTSFNGRGWDQASEHWQIDAVSGATLTSLAVAEGVRFRLGGTRPSLRFPDSLTVQEVAALLPGAKRLAPRPQQPMIQDVYAADDQRLGSVVRTSPAADDVMGYQGPSDTLIVFDADQRVKDMRVRGSFDNTLPEDFVGYVNADEYFKSKFVGLTFEELAALDPEAAEIEGVSGATMTSMSVAYAIPQTARQALVVHATRAKKVSFAWRDAGTVVVLAIALAITFTKLGRNRWMRYAFQALLIVYLGFINGDMVSQALLVGWAQSGVPWRLAPGLTLMTLAALMIPLGSKKQTYCHHVCPFGAVQQLVRNRLPWHVRLPRRLSTALHVLPFLLLMVIVATAMLHLPINLAGIEPFDAFLFNIAGTATLAVAAAGLVASLFVPMAYCRFGCPTGGLLNYLRYNARSDRFNRRDLAAVALLVAALLFRWI